MMIRRLCLLLLIAMPNCAFAVSKEILDLQRDVAQLNDLVKQIQQAQDRQFAALTVLVQQALDASNRADKAVAVIQNGFQQNGNQLKNEVVGPVVGLSTRMDQVSSTVGNLQTAISDLTSAINRIQAQLTDVGNAVKVLSQPPVAPPPQTGAPTGGGAAAAPDVPPVNATDLYNSAQADRLSGKLEFALQEYSQYLKYFGNTNFAPYAQYYIGSIHFSQKNYEAAAADFDTVLEKYQDTPTITAQAHLYKGKSLVELKQRQAGVTEFNFVIKKWPGSENAAQACSELKDLGMNCPKPAAAVRAPGKRKESEN